MFMFAYRIKSDVAIWSQLRLWKSHKSVSQGHIQKQDLPTKTISDITSEAKLTYINMDDYVQVHVSVVGPITQNYIYYNYIKYFI